MKTDEQWDVMKPFHEQFKDRIDPADGSAVLRIEEYHQIITNAYLAGQQSTIKWVSEECLRNAERLTSGAWLKDVLDDAKRSKGQWPDWAKK